MGRVLHVSPHIKAVAPYIATEDDAIDVARSFASVIANTSGHCAIPHSVLLGLLAQSGLMGLSVPSEYGGADISNVSLADVLSIIAEADRSIAQAVRVHFQILETLRVGGTASQKTFFFTRALAGDQFASANELPLKSALTSKELLFSSDGPGFTLKNQQTGIENSWSHWTAIFGTDAQGELAIALMPQVPDQQNRLSLTADGVVPYHVNFQSTSPFTALTHLLTAAIDLGSARASFRVLMDKISEDLSSPEAAASLCARTSEITMRIEAASAVLERAGRRVDMAQIDPSKQNAGDAELSARAAQILAQEAYDIVTNGVDLNKRTNQSTIGSVGVTEARSVAQRQHEVC